ncbi:MAG: hypothetical protein HRU00_12760 [Myxococcales bacterium]|nr:hypothetical protein [Myxococcales bacterium]
MGSNRFQRLARELAKRDADLVDGLEKARAAAQTLQAHARACVACFCEEVRASGAEHLANLAVGPVGWDEKHVDCFEFRATRGRFEVVFVFKASGTTTFVGPFKRGGPECPCTSYDPGDPEAEAGVEARLLALIRQASER